MRKERVNEIWGVVFLLLGLFTFASLAFFHQTDHPFYTSDTNSPVLNHTGVIGANLAHALFISFGLGAYLIPLFFLLWSWCFFGQRVPERKIFKLLGLGIALVAASVFLGISFYPENRFVRAGAIGCVLGERLLRYFGVVGSYIVTASCLLLAILLATDFLIYPIVRNFWENLTEFSGKSTGPLIRFIEWIQELRVRIHKPKVRSEAVRDLTRQRPGSSEEKREIHSQEPVKIVEYERKDTPREPSHKEPKREPVVNRTKSAATNGDYQLPSLDLLRKPEAAVVQTDDLRQNSRIVEETLSEFGIEARIVAVEQGPVITRYELLPAPGVKVTRILSLGDDLSLALKATSLRFIAPIPGKSAIGIEVPNSKTTVVYLRELLEAREFRKEDLALPLVIGKDTSGKPLITDLTQMPHLMIAGTTGSGKTVCVNSIIAGLLYRMPPDRLKFVMVDPKMVELAVYQAIPHMLAPVVTDPKKAAVTLNWVVSEMENRYRLFASRGVRNIQGFNSQAEETLPYIVVVIDELADLMVVAQDKVESAITRLAQLSRAVGIHLILATQRPSVDVITGVIKANFPARISFKVASKVDSRTVLDVNGADKLLGKGDLLFLQPGESKLVRGQGTFVIDEEISRVAEFVSKQKAPEFHPEISSMEEKGGSMVQEKDELFEDAVRVVLETGVASTSTLQRRLRLGYARAARIIDQMEAERIVGPHRGSKPREILVDRAQRLREEVSQQ
ncbi:MAG: DNA translocase FtsK [Candidatus Omnitrophica bacterium]|nr:DNA translocase FtsK [Candidatus Omnitrophota bacterium]